mmetsp:Transcript_106734/g.334814  ORF Transcript_106734/g.334814 Transcript_106734/m.334814 type:complete len:228 (-) Transcript_106734:162-845(-)
MNRRLPYTASAAKSTARQFCAIASRTISSSARSSSEANCSARGFCLSAAITRSLSAWSSGAAYFSDVPSRSTAASTTALFPRDSSSSSLSSIMPKERPRSISNSCALCGWTKAGSSAPGPATPGTGSRSTPKPTSAPSINIQPRCPSTLSPVPPPRLPASRAAASLTSGSCDRGTATVAPAHSSGWSRAQKPLTSTTLTTSPRRRWPMEGAEVDFQARIATRSWTTR